MIHLLFPFKHLKKKDYIAFNIYHTGIENAKFILDGKIKEGKIVNKTIDVEKQLSKITDMTFGVTSSYLAIDNIFSVFESSISHLIKSIKNKD